MKTIVGSFATHLRHLNVHINDTGFVFDHETTIQVEFRHRHGLQITGSNKQLEDYVNDDNDDFDLVQTNQFLDMPAHVAALEEKRIANDQKGEVIVDFFDDWNAVRRVCCAPRETRIFYRGDYHNGHPIHLYLTYNPDDPHKRPHEYKW